MTGGPTGVCAKEKSSFQEKSHNPTAFRQVPGAVDKLISGRSRGKHPRLSTRKTI